MSLAETLVATALGAFLVLCWVSLETVTRRGLNRSLRDIGEVAGLQEAARSLRRDIRAAREIGDFPGAGGRALLIRTGEGADTARLRWRRDGEGTLWREVVADEDPEGEAALRRPMARGVADFDFSFGAAGTIWFQVSGRSDRVAGIVAPRLGAMQEDPGPAPAEDPGPGPAADADDGSDEPPAPSGPDGRGGPGEHGGSGGPERR